MTSPFDKALQLGHSGSGGPLLDNNSAGGFFFLALFCFVFTLWLISGEHKYMGNWMLQKMQLHVFQCEDNTYFPKTLCAAFYFFKKAVEMSYWGRGCEGGSSNSKIE